MPSPQLFSEAFWQSPGRVGSIWTEQFPVQFHEAGGFWSIARHRDLIAAFTDTDSFSNEGIRTIAIGEDQPRLAGFEAEVHQRRLSSRDKPSHPELRRLMSKPFTPRAVQQLEEPVREICHRLIDEIAGAGTGPELDLVRDFAYPLPVLAVNLVLGVPDSVRWEIGRYSNTTEADMGQYFETLVRDPRFRTGEDLTSQLVRAAADGHPYITRGEVHYFVAAFWTAGNLTTTNLIAHLLVLVEHRPELRSLLDEDRKLIPGFVEECLRHEPPVVGVFRITTGDVELEGQVIPARSRVFALIAGANRDPDVFTHAHRFDITRQPNPHLSFAHGPHFCLGAPLARLEARLALETILDRGLRYRSLPDRSAENRPQNSLNGYRQLPAILLACH